MTTAAHTPEVRQLQVSNEESSTDARRAQRVRIKWSKDGAAIGRLYVGTEFWGAIEWSEQRQAWCVEDAEGACLSHVASIHGQASSKAKAVTLAREMILDGRLPTPQQAKADHEVRRAAQAERRARQPAVQARERARAEERAKSSARWDLEHEDREALPLWEALHEVFDFADPELWKSNSFATLRPRLAVHLRAVAAKLEHDCTYYRKLPHFIAEAEAKLAKVRKVLAAIEHGVA